MAKRNRRRERQEEREPTRKEIRLRARQRERDRKLYLGVGAAVGLAVIIILFGAIYAFVYIPNSALARVGTETIATNEFWRRVRLERSLLVNQLVNMQQLEQQLGQQFFTSQINQIQAQLQSPFALGAQVLDQMIDEQVILQEAAAREITVSDDDVEMALREEIARNRNAVTEPQATETTEAGIDATATATLWTPTPTPTIDASLLVTATATPFPTQGPLPTPIVLSETGYTEGLNELEDSLNELNSVNLAGYREIIHARLVREELVTVISEELVSATEEQVNARHILIRVMTPTLEIDSTDTITAPVAPTDALTGTESLTTTSPTTATESVTETEVVTVTETTDDPAVNATDEATATIPATTPVTLTEGITLADLDSITSALTEGEPITGTGSLTETVAPPTPSEPVERTDAEALALAQELRQRILDGEDFATLAQEYSDDTGSGAQGGDLDWFGTGVMVPSFEETAFALAVGEVSEPVKTQFGYHIIEVLEKDENRPKDEASLEQERAEAFDNWLQEQKLTIEIQRPDNLNARLPRDIR